MKKAIHKKVINKTAPKKTKKHEGRKSAKKK